MQHGSNGYLTRRDIARAYGTIDQSFGGIEMRYPKLKAAGLRVIRMEGEEVVPRRELDEAFDDLELHKLVDQLPVGEMIPAAMIEAMLERVGLDADALRAKSMKFLNFIARPAREQPVQQAARLIIASDEDVVIWLNTPAPALGGRIPIELLGTEDGTSEVEGLILGPAHGNFH